MLAFDYCVSKKVHGELFVKVVAVTDMYIYRSFKRNLPFGVIGCPKRNFKVLTQQER